MLTKGKTKYFFLAFETPIGAAHVGFAVVAAAVGAV